MLRTSLLEDVFFAWSLKPSAAQAWLPTARMKSWIWKGRAWALVVYVRMKDRNFFGIPLPSDSRILALLHLVSYPDKDGIWRKGNLLVGGYTDSLPLALASRLTGIRFKARNLDGIGRGGYSIQVPGISLEAKPGKPGARALGVMRQVMKGDRSGVMAVGPREYYSRLEKSHWRMAPLGCRKPKCLWVDRLGARFEFAFDTSNSRAHWRAWRPCGFGKEKP